MSKLIRADFDGHQITFSTDTWLNATMAAKAFNKDLSHWVRSPETIEYIMELNSVDSTELTIDQEVNSALFAEYVITKQGRNGGTWIHPDLIVLFARWCNVKFAVWCDRFIKSHLQAKADEESRSVSRQMAALEFNSMCDHLKTKRELEGKETQHFHYANEANLVNFAFNGKFEPIDREALSKDDLKLLAALEMKNSTLIGCGIEREERKEILCAMAATHRIKPLK